jgi:protein phosphatase
MSLIDIKKDVFSTTDVGLVREANEDNCGYTATPNGVLCVVCDGMGGHVGGAEASRIAVECIIQHFNKTIYTDVRAALKDALEFANLQIIGTTAERPELKGMGTTACIVLVKDDCVWLAHAGDSRIYLYVAAKQRLYRLTKDHSYVQGLIEQGLIYEEEAEKHPDKNRILKALGIKENLNAEVCSQPLFPAKGDIFLICSDGLSGMVTDKKIEEILANGKTNMQQKETALMSAAKAGGGTDNITFQMIRISNSLHKNSIFESKSNPKRKAEKQLLGRRTLLLIVAAVIVVIAVFLSGLLVGHTINKQPETIDMSKDLEKKDSSQHQSRDTTLDVQNSATDAQDPTIEDKKKDKKKNIINQLIK